jgi:CRISPR-associated protein Csd1
MPNPKAEEAAKRHRASHDFFRSLLREAADACPEETTRVHAVLTFLGDSREIVSLHQQLAEAKAKPTDNATFAVDGTSLLDSKALKQFWRDRRRKVARSSGTSRVCIATGKLADTLNTTEKIKGVPGGLATGTNLISFDKDSFCSFGLEQAQNAALSAPAEIKIRSALNVLIEKSRVQKLVFNDTIHLHWTRQPVEFDPLDPVVSGDPDAVEKLLKSAQQGRQVMGLDANAYYALSLSGNGARIVVRDWLESTVPEVEHHIARWFTELTIVEPGGTTCRRDFRLSQLLWAMANPKLEKPWEALPHGAAEQLLRCALMRTPIPRPILMTALRRETIDRISRDEKTGRNKPFMPARFALIKLCLTRSPNRKEHYTMTEKLDLGSKDIGYLCGQLFAVIGRLQLLALGKIGASIAERTYGGVATRPATTLGPVFTRLPAYLKKANDRFPGAGTNKQKEIEALCRRIEALSGLPRTLGLEEQGRFALGYYCQLAEYRAKREEADIEERAGQLIEATS